MTETQLGISREVQHANIPLRFVLPLTPKQCLPPSPTSCQSWGHRCASFCLWIYVIHSLQHRSATPWLVKGRKWVIGIACFDLLLSLPGVDESAKMRCVTATEQIKTAPFAVLWCLCHWWSCTRPQTSKYITEKLTHVKKQLYYWLLSELW